MEMNLFKSIFLILLQWIVDGMSRVINKLIKTNYILIFRNILFAKVRINFF